LTNSAVSKSSALEVPISSSATCSRCSGV
jgi:hypothetical protein